MDLAQLLRLFPMRAPRLMWFLGAGCSVSAGIPTAGDMVWDFKRLLYCSENRCPIQSVPQLTDLAFRERLTAYFSTKEDYPPNGDDSEYSFYFEETYPNERERRKYIDQIVTQKRAALGHLALGALAKIGKLTRIWTTNFDRLVEDAFVAMLGSTDAFAVATLDNPHQAYETLVEQDRPLIVKLHGDFVSKRLKNTDEELRRQDSELRACLTRECANFGLAVVGYSGRDQSVMDTFDESVEQLGAKAFPGGLFWFHRHGVTPSDRVVRLIESVTATGGDAHLVECDTFDELMRDLFALIEDVPEGVSKMLNATRPRLRRVDVPPPGSGWPVIRLNALPVTSAPTVCRKVVCDIGGTREVRDAIEASQSRIIAMRRSSGVICFGADADVRDVFSSYKIREFDVHSIATERLEFDSAELGLLNESLCKAFSRERPLRAAATRHGWKLYVSSGEADNTLFDALRKCEGGIEGTIPGVNIPWYEAILVKLQRRLERLWFVFEPSIWIDWPVVNQEQPDMDAVEQTAESEADTLTEAVREFVRERSAKRYNRHLIDLMDGWVSVLVSPNTRDTNATVRALGISDGMDASFTLGRTTAFSRRIVRR